MNIKKSLKFESEKDVKVPKQISFSELQVDDCRRTHNYDEFITTFLTMLAQEGALGELVHQHLRAKGKLGALRLNKLKLPMKKAANGTSSSSTTNGTAVNERSPKSVKRRRSGKGGNRKKARKKK